MEMKKKKSEMCASSPGEFHRVNRDKCMHIIIMCEEIHDYVYFHCIRLQVKIVYILLLKYTWPPEQPYPVLQNVTENG